MPFISLTLHFSLYSLHKTTTEATFTSPLVKVDASEVSLFPQDKFLSLFRHTEMASKFSLNTSTLYPLFHFPGTGVSVVVHGYSHSSSISFIRDLIS